MKNLLLLILISSLSYSCSQETLDSCLNESKKLITEAASFQDVILGRMHKAKGKAEFRAIVAEVEAKALTFVDALNALNK